VDINRCREVSLVIGWIGMMRFTGYEAQGIEPLVAQWAKRTQEHRALLLTTGQVHVLRHVPGDVANVWR